MKEGKLSEHSSESYQNRRVIKTVKEPNNLGLSAFRNFRMVSEAYYKSGEGQ
jgi:hypothetical protein